MKPKISQTAGPKLSRSVSTLLVITHHPRKCSGTLAGGNIGRPSHSETTVFCGNTSSQESESKICASTKPGLAFCQPLLNNRQTHILRLKNPQAQSSKKTRKTKPKEWEAFCPSLFFGLLLGTSSGDAVNPAWMLRRKAGHVVNDATIGHP